MAEVIRDEEQFQSLIEAELWYDTSEESDDENDGKCEDPDTELAVGSVFHRGQKDEVFCLICMLICFEADYKLLTAFLSYLLFFL